MAAVRAVIVTGANTVRALEEYGIARDRIAVVEPGTDPAPLSRGSGHPSRPQLVSVATLNPGKGHDILVEALAKVPHRDWRLTCAGSLDRRPLTVDRLRSLIHSKNLEDHVSLVGDLDAPTLNELYDCADVFVLATRRETYGMAVAEALARGLPVVSTRTGAIPDLVGDAAGLLVAPDDVDALTGALSSVIGDPAVRTRLAAGARRVRERLATWDAAAAKMIAALQGVEAR